MSDMSNYYGDFGLSEQRAIRRRLATTLANQQAAFLGQQRGARSLADITRGYARGFRPKQAEYGRRGLGGPKVQSGIRRAGLAEYAQQYQRDIGAETTRLQDELNALALSEASSKQDLEDYVNQLRLQKAQEIMASAAALKQFASY